MRQRVALLLAGMLVTWMVVMAAMLVQLQLTHHPHVESSPALSNGNRSLIVNAQVNETYVVQRLTDGSGLWLATPAEPTSYRYEVNFGGVYVYEVNSSEVLASYGSPVFGWNAPTSTFSLGDKVVSFSVGSSAVSESTQPLFESLKCEPLKIVLPELPGSAINSTTVPAPIDVAMTAATYRSGQSLDRLKVNHPEETLGNTHNGLASFSRLRALHLPIPLHGATGTTGFTTCGGCPWSCSETVKRSVAYVYSNPAKTAWASTGLSCRA